jgi:hypothetical protein
MNDKEKEFAHFAAIGLLIVIIVLTTIRILPVAMGILLGMSSFGSIMWVTMNEKDEDEL